MKIQDYLFYDPSSQAGLSNYASNISLREASTVTISYDSTNKYYTLTNTHNEETFIPITALNNQDNFIIEYDVYNPSQVYIGVARYIDANNWYGIEYTNNLYFDYKLNGSYRESSNGSFSFSPSQVGKWCHISVKVEGRTWTFTISDGMSSTSKSITYSSSLGVIGQFGFSVGVGSGTRYLRNIVAYSI